MAGKRLYFAASGDLHGKEDLLWRELHKWEQKNKKKISAVLPVGDFDTIAHERLDRGRGYSFVRAPEYVPADEEEPDLFSRLVDYHWQRKKVPYKIIFNAGNNDEWGILRDIKDGGWLIDDIVYFLGRSGVCDFNGIKIGGLSGVFRERYYQSRLSEQPDFSWQYFRKKEVDRLMGNKLDILLLHQWVEPFPKSAKVIEQEGIKRIYRDKVDNHLLKLIESTQPKYVFMGHNHRRYVDAKFGKSRLLGLMRVTKNNLESGLAYKIFSMEARY